MGMRRIAREKLDQLIGAISVGTDIALSCRLLKINRATIYREIKRNKRFGTSIEDAKEVCVARLKKKLYDTAMDGNVTAMIFGLKNLDPTNWRDRHELDHSGEVRITLVEDEGGAK